MNRRQKIIVSVTGIFIVLLALVGITFAYFLTRIQGNNNPTSISVTTANLSLVYADDSSDLITSTEPIIPSFIDTKSFTVTNNGNATVTDYAVILEEYGVTYASDATLTNEDGSTTDVYAGQSTDLKYDDFKLTITCTSYENYGKTGEAVKGTCNGMDGVLPAKSDILLMNDIDAGITHVYELTLEYKETDENQSADMNKTITGKINIMDTKGTVDLTGQVAVTYDVGDYVQINSEEKMSPIYSDGTYKLMGVKPDNHNIKICDSANPTCTKENANSNSDLVVLKGETASSSGNTITITDSSRTVNMNVTSSGVTVGTIEKYNPYTSGTLAYKIYNSATSGETGKTVLVDSPSTPIGSKFEYETNFKETKTEEDYLTFVPTVGASETFPCYTGYKVDEGKVTFTGEKQCGLTVVVEGYVEGDTNVYIIGDAAYGSIISQEQISSASDQIVYKYIEGYGPDYNNGGGMIFGKIVTFEVSTDNTTKELLKTTDNDGSTYYFRGMPEDNYVNFAGKCWRIVRIQGDGSIKLILEDDSQTCSTSMDRNSYLGPDNYPAIRYEDGDYPYLVAAYNLVTDENRSVYGHDDGIASIFKAFQSNISSYLGSLEEETWCWGNDGIVNTNLECRDKTIDKFSDGTSMYVGTITYNEAKFAGDTGELYYNDYYEQESKKRADYYLLSDYSRNNNILFWTMSANTAQDDAKYIYNAYSSIYSYPYASSNYEGLQFNNSWEYGLEIHARPAVVLRNGITATGTGTITDPYKVG